jgi:hypothetical protein
MKKDDEASFNYLRRRAHDNSVNSIGLERAPVKPTSVGWLHYSFSHINVQ